MEERRTHVRRSEDRLVVPRPYIPTRRVPGTLALASTNFLAAYVGFDPELYADVEALRYVQRITPFSIWAIVFLLSGLLLLLSTITRRWFVFNAGAVLSLFLWATVVFSLFAVWLRGTLVSPIGLAMAWWMLVGQITMLAVPLFKRWGGGPDVS